MMKKHLAGLRIAILSAGVIASVPVLSLHAADPLGGEPGLAVLGAQPFSTRAEGGEQADFGETASGLSIQIGRTFAAAREAREKREPARPRYDTACILSAVASQMGVTLRGDVPVPQVFYGSNTPLKQLQDAVEPQWGFRPDVFANVYVFARNEIYLWDDAAYYVRMKRSIDDSLAHELVHFIQVKYQNASFAGGGEDLESQAVHVQTWFRENHIQQPGVCAR